MQEDFVDGGQLRGFCDRICDLLRVSKNKLVQLLLKSEKTVQSHSPEWVNDTKNSLAEYHGLFAFFCEQDQGLEQGNVTLANLYIISLAGSHSDILILAFNTNSSVVKGALLK